MVNWGHEHVAHLAGKVKHLTNRITNMRNKGERSARAAISGVEIFAGAFGAGVLQGHAGEEGAHILHIPADLAIGGALVALGVFEVAGDYSEHVSNVGLGAIAAWGASKGYGVGKQWHDTGHLFGGGGGGGALPPGTAIKGELDPRFAAEVAARFPAGVAQHG